MLRAQRKTVPAYGGRLHQVLVSPKIGGAALVAIQLASRSRELGYRTRAWVPGPGAASAALAGRGVEWRTYDLEGMRRSTWQHVVAGARMLTGIAERRRAVVHIHNPVVYRILRPALAAAGARIVVHFHIEPSDEEIAWTLEKPPNHVVTCARYIGAAIEKCLGSSPPMPITSVQNAVDLDRFAPGSKAAARSRVGIDTPRFVVLLMANLAEHKGQLTAIRATSSLRERGVDVECWLVGEDRSGTGHYERGLRDTAAGLDISDRIRFLGFRADAPELFRAADAVVLPSTHEGLPLSLLEAQACGTPVVASDIPGILEIVKDGETGFIVKADDSAGYADRLETLSRQPQLRDALVNAAMMQVQNNNGREVFNERMFRIYESLMD